MPKRHLKYLIVRFGDQPRVFREKLLPQLEARGQVFDGVRVVLVFDRDLAEGLVGVAKFQLDGLLVWSVGLQMLQIDDLKSFLSPIFIFKNIFP